MNRHKILIEDKARIRCPRGPMITPNYPYYETAEGLRWLFTQRPDAKIMEIKPDGSMVALNASDFVGGEEPPVDPEEPTPGPILITEISVMPNPIELIIGGKANLNVSVKPTVHEDTVSYRSSDNGVVTVVDGEVTAIAEGTATITVAGKNVSATTEVRVNKPAPVLITDILIGNEPIALSIGETTELEVIVDPTDNEDTLAYTSSNEDVATVSGTTVNAVGAGSAIITVSATNVSTTVDVTVVEA